MISLRARWYDAGSGTFTSFRWQTHESNDLIPASHHPYQYVLNDPVNSTDPAGTYAQGIVAEQDFRDLTDWLYRAMVQNVTDPRLMEVRAYNMLGDMAGGAVREDCASGMILVGWDNLDVAIKRAFSREPLFWVATGHYVVAGKLFYDLVKDRGPWDFKHLIKRRLGEGITLCSSGECRTDVDYGVPGNIHFGFVSRAGGYYGWEIQAGAGIAEIADPAHKPGDSNYVPYEGEFGILLTAGGPSLNFGDDRDDNNDVQFGIDLYNTYGPGLTLAQFRKEFDKWLSSLKGNTPSDKPIKQDVKDAYPYPFDYFNYP